MAYVISYADRFGKWTPVSLSDEQEQEVRAIAIKRHQEELYSCFGEAKTLLKAVMQHGEIPPTVLATVAISLFSARVVHLQYCRENFARTVFEKTINGQKSSIIQSVKGGDF